MNNTPQLDAAQLATLRPLRNGQLLGQLIRTYREQTQQQLATVTTALAAADIDCVGAVAHSLKSGSFSLGATHMGQLCAALEQAALSGDLLQCAYLIKNLQSSFTALLPELAQYE